MRWGATGTLLLSQRVERALRWTILAGSVLFGLNILIAIAFMLAPTM